MKDVMMEAFLVEMLETYADDIAAIELPEGIHDYVVHCVQHNDSDKLAIMLRLAYVLGLHTGFAAFSIDDTEGVDDEDDGLRPQARGQKPLQA